MPHLLRSSIERSKKNFKTEHENVRLDAMCLNMTALFLSGPFSCASMLQTTL